MDIVNAHRLRVFVEAAEALSFSRAADRLFISQPAVSQRVRELEDLLGTPLFDRLNNSLALTEAGQVLLGHAGDILALVSATETAVRATGNHSQSGLSLGVFRPWGPVVAEMVAEFGKTHAWTQLSVMVADQPEVVEGVRGNQLNLGIVPGPLEDARLDCLHVMDDYLLFVAAPGHPLANGRRIQSRDLESGLPLLYKVPSGGFLDRVLRTLKVTSQGVVHFNDKEAAKRAVLCGLGVGVAFMRAARKELATGDLVPVLLEGTPFRLAAYAVRNKARRPFGLEEAFLANVCRTAEDLASVPELRRFLPAPPTILAS